MTMRGAISRREFFQGLGVAAAGLYAGVPRLGAATPLPCAPVAVAQCPTYGRPVHVTLSTMFDQVGGLDRLVRGKTVAVKLNMTGEATDRLRGMPLELTHWVHPDVITSTISLLGEAGARRIRLVESTLSPVDSLRAFMRQAGWNPQEFSSAAANVEFEDTNYAGPSGKYVRLWVPGGGMLFKAYNLNHSYTDCDVYVSLAKLKEHATAGVTLSMKNSFGITPATIYGKGAGIDEPAKVVKGSRDMIHYGNREPSRVALPEKDPSS
ncbi:MAG: DUF362 domain-containing protein, partial [Terriglobia bacterium]